MKNIILGFFSLLLNSGFAQTTGNQKIAAFTSHTSMPKGPNANWRLLGSDFDSGRCTDVWSLPEDHNTIYATFATGGVWKTTDGGKVWNPIFDGQATQSIGNMAIAASDHKIIYVGTGEANIFRASLPGLGMYRSADGGASWRHIGLQNTGTIARIVVHPKNANHLYVAASGNEWTPNKDRGVYRSFDGGKTWKNILFVNNTTGCIDLVMDPSNPKTIYASMWNRTRRRWSDPVPEDGDYIYKTTDGGNTWKKLSNGLPETKNTGRIGLALCATKPNVVYAYVDNHTPKREGKDGELDSYGRPKKLVINGAEVYKSMDKGESWTKMSENDKTMETFGGTYGWVFSQIRVDPQNENRLYIMGLSIGKSEDGGKTWDIIHGGNTRESYIHGDHHGMWIDPKNTDYILNANDGGVTKSEDGGKTWINFFKEIPTTQFYNVSYDMAKPFNIHGSVQDEGSRGVNVDYVYNSKTKNGWREVPGGEGSIIAIDPTDANITYSSAFYGRIQRADLSKADSLQIKNITIKKSEGEDTHRGEWLAYTLISKYDHKTIYHGMQYLFKSTDQGESWTRISPDLSKNDPNHMGKLPYAVAHQAITAIGESNFKPGQLVVGTDDGNLWVTSNEGIDWTFILNGLPKNMHVSRIEMAQDDANTIFLTLNGRRDDINTPMVYMTNNLGKTWRNISGNLPHSPANVIRQDPKNHKVLYCGTDMGIYMSSNKGKTWKSIQHNLPKTVSVQDLFVHPRDNKLVIATYGRGVWVVDDASVFQK